MVVKRKAVTCQLSSELTNLMDKNVWQSLPEDLIDRVLACLPLISLYRFRSVCKKWNLMIHSPIFLDIYAEIPFREAYFLLFPSLGEETVCSVFSSSLRRWHKMPSLAFLPPHVKYVDGGAGGLLLFSVGSQTHSVSLYVCNPMTKQWRQLPSVNVMHNRTPIVRHMVVDKKTREYKIILAGSVDLTTPETLRVNPSTSTAVYDSTCQKWSKSGRLPFNVDLNWSTAYSDGLLFCVANEVGSSKLGITTYDVQQGVWSDGLYKFPKEISLAQLVESRGSIFAISELYKYDHLKSIHILKFNLETGSWTEISKLPRSFLRDFRSVCEEESFNSVVLGDKIFLTSFRGMQVLVFDISLRFWSWLTPCQHYVRFDPRAVGFAFEPCPHISA